MPKSKEARARLKIVKYLREKTAGATPIGFEHKDYGPHKYAGHDGTSDCEHECGCWMGPARSGGPAGIDPGGKCPGNPLDGKPLGGAPLKERPRTPSDGTRPGYCDQEYVVGERIALAETRVNLLIEMLVQANANPNLADAINAEKRKSAKLRSRIRRIKDITKES